MGISFTGGITTTGRLNATPNAGALTLTPDTFDTATLLGGSNDVFSNGDRTWQSSTDSGGAVMSQTPQGSGKWYVELSLDSLANSPSQEGFTMCGIQKDRAQARSDFTDNVAESVYVINAGGGSPTWTGGSTLISIAFDRDNGILWFAEDGVWKNGATLGEIASADGSNAHKTGLTDFDYAFHGGDASSLLVVTWTCNAGQDAFTYTVPTGFTAGWGTLA